MKEETKQKLSQIMRARWLMGNYRVRVGRPKAEFIKCNRKYWDKDEQTHKYCARLRSREKWCCSWCEEHTDRKPRCDVKRYYPFKYDPQVIIDIEI